MSGVENGGRAFLYAIENKNTFCLNLKVEYNFQDERLMRNIASCHSRLQWIGLWLIFDK